MADNKYNETLARLRAYGQEHLLDGYETLTGAEQAELLKDIDGADLAQMAELYRKALRHQQGGEVKAEELTPLTPVDAEKGIFQIFNRHYFSSLDGYTVKYWVERDGKRPFWWFTHKLHFTTADVDGAIVQAQTLLKVRAVEW